MNLLGKKELSEFLNRNVQSIVFAHLAIEESKENIDHALELCNTHLQNNPDYGFGYFVKGYLLYKKEEYEQALNELEMATILNPSIIKAWELKQAIYSQLGQEEKMKLANAFVAVWQGETSIEQEILIEEDQLLQEVEASENIESLDLEDTLISDEELLGEMESSLPEDEEEVTKAEQEFADQMDESQSENLSESEEKLVEDKEEIKDIDFSDDTSSENISSLMENLEEEYEEEGGNEEPNIVGTLLETDSSLDNKEEFIMDSDLEKMEKKENSVTTENQDKVDKTIVEKEITESLGDFEINTADEADLGFVTSENVQGETKVVTSTLGEIYIAQGKFKEALEVFKTLLEENPENRRYKRKVKELEELIKQSNK